VKELIAEAKVEVPEVPKVIVPVPKVEEPEEPEEPKVESKEKKGEFDDVTEEKGPVKHAIGHLIPAALVGVSDLDFKSIATGDIPELVYKDAEAIFKVMNLFKQEVKDLIDKSKTMKVTYSPYQKKDYHDVIFRVSKREEFMFRMMFTPKKILKDVGFTNDDIFLMNMALLSRPIWLLTLLKYAVVSGKYPESLYLLELDASRKVGNFRGINITPAELDIAIKWATTAQKSIEDPDYVPSGATLLDNAQVEITKGRYLRKKYISEKDPAKAVKAAMKSVVL
jgi:hypothetical protein